MRRWNADGGKILSIPKLCFCNMGIMHNSIMKVIVFRKLIRVKYDWYRNAI